VRAELGAKLLGSYKAAKIDGSVRTMWVTDAKQYALMTEAYADSAWRRAAPTLRHTWREELWIAGPGSRFDRSDGSQR
jgi:hypothetical protein